MEKQAHYLNYVLSQRAPSQVCTVHAVSAPDGACRWYAIFARREDGQWTRRHERSGNSAAEWWSWIWSIGSIGRRLWVFAPRWVQIMDALDVVDETTFGAGALGKRVVSEGCTMIELAKAGRSLTMIDAANWWDTLPDWLAVPKDAPLSTEERVEESCRRLWSLVTSTIDQAVAADLGVIQPTIGSWASNVWRHWHRGQRVIVHTDIDAAILERRAYMGGQCIVHKTGVLSGPWYGIDCNMMYPWAMSSCLQPYQLVAYNPHGDVRLLELMSPGQGAIAEVELSQMDWTYPYKSHGQLRAARGTFWTVLAWPELSYALSQGHVRTVRQVCIYSLADLFSVWANRLWSLRLTTRASGRVDFATLLKRLGAALHGKLGQLGAEWVEGLFPCIRPWAWWPVMMPDRTVRRRRAIGLAVEEKWQADDEPNDSFPGIAAWTTSGARQRMSKLRARVGRDNWVYQFSDQLVVNAEGFARLTSLGEIDPDRLGAFKVEFESRQVEIRGPGWIMHDARRRAAGIGAGAKEVEPDIYTIECQQTMAGKFGPTGPKKYTEWVRKVHYPASKVVGELAADGFIDPPTL